MSYLLTEIALEMLGYKFYDVHGHYGPTDFQNIPCESSKSEESLERLLQLDGLIEIVTKPDEKLHISNEAISEKSTKTQIHSDSNDSKLKHSIPTQSLPTKLTDLFDCENKKLREEVQSNITNCMESKRKNPANKDVDEVLIHQELVDEQQQKLINEARMMREFRLFAEDKLAKINPNAFKMYNNTFNQHNRNE